ncbi:MAG: YihY/virulence factor BrkB family protein [Phycisphaerae bacterium]|nr:YihY/virulence factor BrkB family protein [Phycisphaerae bacterium]
MPDLPESERLPDAAAGAGTVVAQVAPDADAGPSHPFARRVSILELVGNFLQTLGVWLGQDAMPRMAAALAYRTVFSLIPFLVLSFLVFRLFPNSEKLIADFLEQVIAKSGLDKIATDKQSVGEWLKGTVGSFKGINFGAIGAVSGAVFIYGALALLVDIESSFNAIYGVSRARSWARRIAQYWLIVSLGPLVLYTGFAVGEKFNTWAQESVRQVSSIVENNTGLGTPTPQSPTPPTTNTADPDAAPEPAPAAPTAPPPVSPADSAQATSATPAATGSPAGSATPTPTPPRDGSVTAFLIRVTGFLVTVCLSAFLLAVLYLTVPNTSVRLLPAIAGALTGGLLLDLAKSSFRSFFSAESYASVYGSLALLPLFLLWVYITWFIVLLGLRVSFLVQHGRTGVLLQAFSAKNRSSLGGSWMEPARSVAVVVEIADAFAQGRTVAPWKLAEHAGMDEPSLRLLLSNLEAAGVLHRVSSEGREETFALSRPAEAIAVAEIVAIAQSLAGPVSPGATGDLLAKVRSAQLQAVANVNLGSLVSAGKSRRTPRPASPLPAATAAPDAAPAPAAPPSPSTT